MKVIPGEEIESQHCLLLMDMVFKKKVRRKIKLRKKLKLWMLRKSEVKEEFAKGVNNKCDGNNDWCGLKKKVVSMLRVRSVVILKANLGLLKRGGGIKMWMWLWNKERVI